MPRNGSSVYSLPAGNPVVPGTTISTTWANTTLTDIGTALTQSLSTDGSTAAASLAGKTISGGTFTGPTVSGALNLTSGQITFPAVQAASSGVNVLDDYEEGTFTPTLTYTTPGNISVVYSTRVGLYTKIGDLVFLAIRIITTTFTYTTSAGSMIITGSPFAPANVTGMATAGPLSRASGLSLGTNSQIALEMFLTDASLYFIAMDVGAGTSAGIGAGAATPTAVQKEFVGTITFKAPT